MFALGSLAAPAFAQDWTSEATYTKTVTTTTVTTYTPSYQTNSFVQPWNNAPDAPPAYAPAPQPQPTIVQANYVQPTYAAPANSDAINLRANYPQPSYVAYSQPASMPVNYAPAAYVQPTYVRPVVYTQPSYAVQPVAATYYKPVYRPMVVGYTPTYVASPATCEVPAAQPVVAAAPAGPKVWVHEKVYVQGQPLRNLLTAVTP